MSKNNIPLSLKITSILFILSGVLSLINILYSIIVNNAIRIDIGIIAIFIGLGIFKLREWSRTAGLYFLRIAIVINILIFLGVLFIKNITIYPGYLNLSKMYMLAFIILSSIVYILMYLVLKKKEIRELFKWYTLDREG